MSDDGKMIGERDRDRRLTIYRCSGGHSFLYPHTACPMCGNATREFESSSHARLVTYTTVRVTPTGQQLQLGLAQTEDGAKTLCIIDEDVEGDCVDVTLYLENDLYHARCR